MDLGLVKRKGKRPKGHHKPEIALTNSIDDICHLEVVVREADAELIEKSGEVVNQPRRAG